MEDNRKSYARPPQGTFRPLGVSGIGMVSSVGRFTDETCASIRSDVNMFVEHAFYTSIGKDPEWDEDIPLIVAPVAWISPFEPGIDRLVALGLEALQEAISDSGIKRSELARTTLLVALPESDSVVLDWGKPEDIANELVQRTGLQEMQAIKARHTGHTGMFELLWEASSLVYSKKTDRCIVLGIDSYLSPDRLAVWDEQYRLRSLRNVDGFIPGEAACALCVQDPNKVRDDSGSIRSMIAAASFAMEKFSYRSEKQSSASGLMTALKTLPGGFKSKGSALPWICLDLNGESYRAYEWAMTLSRMGDALGSVELTHPADCLGDVGAATGGMLIAYATSAFVNGFAPNTQAILVTTADTGQRTIIKLHGV